MRYEILYKFSIGDFVIIKNNMTKQDIIELKKEYNKAISNYDKTRIGMIIGIEKNKYKIITNDEKINLYKSCDLVKLYNKC